MNMQTMERPATLRGTITVQRCFPAKAAGKSATIKDVDGMMFGYWPNKLGPFRDGESYEIEYIENVRNGTIYRDLTAATMAAKPASAPAQFSTGGHDNRQPGPRAAQPPEPQRQAPPQNGNGGGNYRPTAPKDARRMFICSQMNALITSHQVQPTAQAIADAIVMLSDAYDATLGREDAQ